MQNYYRWCAHLGYQQSTELKPSADLNGLVRFAERRNLVSAHVPSHFNWLLVLVHADGYFWGSSDCFSVTGPSTRHHVRPPADSWRGSNPVFHKFRNFLDYFELPCDIIENRTVLLYIYQCYQLCDSEQHMATSLHRTDRHCNSII